MNQTEMFKQSLSVAILTLLQPVIPPLVVFVSLYFCSGLYSVPFDESFAMLAMLVIALSVVLLQPSSTTTNQLLSHRIPIAVGLIVRWIVLLGALFAIGYATKYSAIYSRRVVLTWALITPAILIVVALGYREVLRRLMTTPGNARSVVVAGCNEVSASLAEQIKSHPELCMSVVGFFDDRSPDRLALGADVPLLGKLPDLATFVKAQNTEVIFIALPVRHISRVMNLLDDLRDTTASIYYVPDILVFDLIQSRTGQIMGIPVVAMCETPFFGLRGLTKRMTDILISSFILLPGLPVLLFIALLVKLTSKGPAIFKQKRYGLDGRQITVYKFRTMYVTENGARVTQAKREDSRITAIGRFLRRSSLDELPQLINVLQGRMSLVGPRPHAVAHNEEYRKLIKGYMVRHKVLPGITGLAQVNGCRGETSRLEEMQARVNYDLEYLRHWSPMLDLKILALTVLRVFGDERAY